MGFKGDTLKQMIGLVQGGDRKALKAAALVSYRNGPGLMTHYFTPELPSEDIQRWVEYLRDNDLLVEEPTSLWTIREHFLPQAESLIQHGERSLVERIAREIR